MTKEKDTLTTAFGIPVADDQNSLTAGARGPVLMQDAHLLEKLAHFDRERIPERVVHAKGAGAGGYFEVTADVTRYTKAKFLSASGQAHRGLRPLFHGGRRKRLRRRRPGPPGVRRQILYGRGQLRFGGQQHPGIFHPGPPEISRLHPYPEAASGHQL